MKGSLIIFALFLFSCHTTRDVVRTVIQVDSTAARTVERMRSDSISIAAIHRDQLEQARKAKVNFDCNCDTIIIMPGTNADSLVKVIEAQKSRIRKFADGSIEITGKLTSAEEILKTTQSNYDSLGAAYFGLQAELDSTRTALNVSKTEKQRTVERTVFPWYFWLLLILSAGAGWWLKKKTGI